MENRAAEEVEGGPPLLLAPPDAAAMATASTDRDRVDRVRGVGGFLNTHTEQGGHGQNRGARGVMILR